MNDIIQFFGKLFDTSDWPARWHCGNWTDFHGWLYIVSDLLIWISYFTIPAVIIKYLSRRKHQRFMPLYFLFATFILACGTSHLLDAVAFWIPLYRLNALVKAITAIVSIATAFYLIKLLPFAFKLSPPKVLEAEIEMRRKVEADLQYRNEQMAEAEIVGNFGSYEWNIGTGELQLSKGMKHLLGEPDLSTMNYEQLMQLIPVRERQREVSMLQECIVNKKYKAHYQNITARGGRTLFTRGKEVLDKQGELVKFIGTSHDVTEIRKNKELLNESRQKFESAFRFSAIGMALVDVDGKWLDANEATCTMLGYPKDELQQLTFQQLTYEDDIESDMQQVNKMLAREITNYQLEKRYIKKTGEIVWALLSVSLVWKNDEPSFFISQIIDITFQKSLMVDLTNNNLALVVANKKLEYHMARVNEFNRIIAHNLRGPAASLINLADYVLNCDNEEDKKFLLSQVKSTSEGILHTLDDLKEFIEIYLQEKTLQPASFEAAYSKSLQLLQEQVVTSKAVINVDFQAKFVNLPTVYLESCLYNLLSNALKYRRSATKPIIHIQTRYRGKVIEMVVKDNGIGLDLNKFKGEIFKYKKVFHKGYNSNGIGLFLTKTQLEAYGATIEIYSEVDEGAAFHVTFEP